MAWDFSTAPDVQRELDWIRDLVARMVLRRYAAVDGYPTEHIPTRRAAAEKRFAACLEPVTA